MGSDDDLEDGWKRLAQRSYTVQVPEGWTVKQDELGERILVQPTAGAVTCVEVVARTFGHRPTLDDHADHQLDELRDAIPGVQLEAREPTSLGGNDAYRFAFTFDSGQPLRAWRVLGLDGHVGVRVTYLAPAAAFDDHDATAREIAGTLAYVRAG